MTQQVYNLGTQLPIYLLRYIRISIMAGLTGWIEREVNQNLLFWFLETGHPCNTAMLISY